MLGLSNVVVVGPRVAIMLVVPRVVYSATQTGVKAMLGFSNVVGVGPRVAIMPFVLGGDYSAKQSGVKAQGLALRVSWWNKTDVFLSGEPTP